MRSSRLIDRPEPAVAPRTLAELLATDPAADGAGGEDVPAVPRRARRRPRAARTLRNAK